MNLYQKFKYLSLAALALFIVGSLLEAKAPNILFFFSDDAGYADFGFQGSKTHLTPNLDAIAASGVRFTRSYVTGPVCSPSRAGLLTGRYQQYFGHGNNLPNPHPLGLPLEERLMPEYLKELGYGTYMIGKWHLGIPEPYQPQDRGFDKFFGILEGARHYFQMKKPSYGKSLVENGKVVPGMETKDLYVTDAFGDKAVEYLKAHHEDHPEKPFFMFLSFTAPHNPMDAKPEDLALFKDVEFKHKVKDRDINAAMTYSMDREIGRVIDLLKSQGEYENTLIVFFNDNGGTGNKNGSVNYPLRGFKSSLFEGGLRVPMLMSWYGVLPEGVDFDGTTSAFDLLPTFVRAAGGTLDLDREIEGVDLIPFLKGAKTGDPHTTLAWRIKGAKGRKALMHEDWKYINWEGHESLFHIESDMSEKNDLSESEPEKFEELRRRMAAWETNAIQPLWWWNDAEADKYRVDE